MSCFDARTQPIQVNSTVFGTTEYSKNLYIICFFANLLRRSYLHGKHVFLQEIILLPSQLTTFQWKQGEFWVNDTRLFIKKERGRRRTQWRLWNCGHLNKNPSVQQLKIFSLLKYWHFTMGERTRALILQGFSLFLVARVSLLLLHVMIAILKTLITQFSDRIIRRKKKKAREDFCGIKAEQTAGQNSKDRDTATFLCWKHHWPFQHLR